MHRQVVTAVVAVTVLLASFSGVAVGQAPQVTAQSDGAVDCEYPVSATDATGAEVTVDEEPDRVVVIGPSAAQVMWEIGAQDKVVGMPVGQYTSYLEGSESKTNVVDNRLQPVREKVVGLNPDLVLAPNIVNNETVNNLRDAGLTVYRFEAATSFDDVTAKTELTGRLVGEFESAAQVSAETQATVDAVRAGVDGEERPRVYYPLGDGYTAGNNTFINDIINSAGGDNIAADVIDGYVPPISAEVVADRDPQWLVVQEGSPVPSNEAVNGSTAVRENQIVRVNGNYINQPGPRTTLVLRTLAEAFHPDAYEQIDFENVETPDPTTCGADETPDSESASANGPGFGVGVAVIAMLVAGLLAGRRS
ncbi:PGF-CTERM-anchored ABC transporter substrate-binding protein [Salinibaculum rarum]|uniref:PGF-CTERM-anchored ABC transporter substrate-binding protein n=1 Tax=Salinibaculum rarum TaxID=3058903 RepID=UPI00265FFFDE|nr:PGF-CTERM-anchored ABC transporter substrate-binding protein [Salinibaculum sp. KK48]